MKKILLVLAIMFATEVFAEKQEKTGTTYSYKNGQAVSTTTTQNGNTTYTHTYNQNTGYSQYKTVTKTENQKITRTYDNRGNDKTVTCSSSNNCRCSGKSCN